MKIARRFLLDNPLLTGSFLMLFGSNLANVIAYLYHFILGRMLDKAQYGELAAFLSLLGFLGSLYSFLGLLIVKYAAKGTTPHESLKNFYSLYTFFRKPVVGISLVLLLLTPFVSSRLQLSLVTYLLIAPIFFLSFMIFLYKSFLQGRLEFGKVSLYTIAEMTGRLGLGLLFVKLGFSAPGAAIGFFLTLLFVWLLLKRDVPFVGGGHTSLDKKALVHDAIPVFVSSLATTAFFSMDILLVRALFSASDAGTYAAASTLGKTILFASAPLTAVLFPIISKKHAQGEAGTLLFFMSFAITFCIGGVFALAFYFFPLLAVQMSFGASFLTAAPLMFPYSIFMLLFVLCLVFVNYYLPKEQYYPIKSLAVAAVVQTVGIILFHTTLLSVVYVSIIVVLALFVNLLIYFAYENKGLKSVLSKALRHYSGLQG